MLRRSAVILALAALFTNLFLVSIPSAHASVHSFAQEDSSENAGEGEESGTEEEVGSNEGQSEPAEEETGPPWTYQMGRLTAILLVIMALSIGLLYWRLVVKRQRQGI